MTVRNGARRAAAIVGGAMASLLIASSVAMAAEPDHTGPFAWDDTIYIPDFCGDMNVRLDTRGTESYTIWAEGEDVVKVLYRVRAPHDVFTNLDTGTQIVVRGEFQEMIERIPGTDEFTKSISGFRYLVNEPGRGVVVQEVGRIVYGDLEQTLARWEAGKHELVYNQDFVILCDLLA